MAFDPIDAKCEAAKMLMLDCIRHVDALANRLPVECARAALAEVERRCHDHRTNLILADVEHCSCLLREYVPSA